MESKKKINNIFNNFEIKLLESKIPNNYIFSEYMKSKSIDSNQNFYHYIKRVLNEISNNDENILLNNDVSPKCQNCYIEFTHKNNLFTKDILIIKYKNNNCNYLEVSIPKGGEHINIVSDIINIHKTLILYIKKWYRQVKVYEKIDQNFKDILFKINLLKNNLFESFRPNRYSNLLINKINKYLKKPIRNLKLDIHFNIYNATEITIYGHFNNSKKYIEDNVFNSFDFSKTINSFGDIETNEKCCVLFKKNNLKFLMKFTITHINNCFDFENNIIKSIKVYDICNETNNIIKFISLSACNKSRINIYENININNLYKILNKYI